MSDFFGLREISAQVDGFVWGWIMIALCLSAGVFFSIMMRFPQLRLIKDMVGQLLSGKSSAKGVSSFQGFAMALGGRVGTGNITGTASAIYFGGPGAVFWMWVIAFLGAGSAYIEAALAQVWKEEIHGEYRGGPAYYIEQGLRSPRLGIAFSIFIVVCCDVLLPGIQSNSFAVAAREAFGISPGYMAIAYVLLLAYIIFGGGKRIAKAAEMIVPFMAIGYILLALVILFIHAQRIPSIFSLIFSSAFNMNAVYGAIFGQAVLWGVKRGIFSNEAGQGTGAQAAGAAEVSHPAKQGLVQAFSVYVDTLFVCTATAVMILATDAFNVALPGGGLLVENLPGVEYGNFTQNAVNSLGTGLGGIFVAIALFFFTLTTVLAYAYYVDSNVGYLFRHNSEGLGYRVTLNVSRMVIIVMVALSTMMSAEVVWNFGSAGVGVMAWFNVIVILMLTRPGIRTLRDYEAQKRMGLDPVFVPERCGIEGADLWHDIASRNYPEQLDRLRSRGGLDE